MLEKTYRDADHGLGSGDLPISTVIPLFNEEKIVAQNLESLAQFYNQLVGHGNWLFILVDNGSTDRTPELVKAAMNRWPPSRTVYHPEPNYGAALRVGLLAATTKWVFMHDVEQWDLPFMEWAWAARHNYDLLMGSKRADPTINEQKAHRRFLSAGLNGALQVIFQFSGSDTHGPKLLNRDSLDSLIQICRLNRGQFDTELVLRAIRAGKRVAEAPIEYRETRPQRNLMIKKIVWNLLALRRLRLAMRDVPFEAYVRYHRFTREDVLAKSRYLVPDAWEQPRV
jgi:glycosyltransferase involved in cell wall biosynthesis